MLFIYRINTIYYMLNLVQDEYPCSISFNCLTPDILLMSASTKSGLNYLPYDI